MACFAGEPVIYKLEENSGSKLADPAAVRILTSENRPFSAARLEFVDITLVAPRP